MNRSLCFLIKKYQFNVTAVEGHIVWKTFDDPSIQQEILILSNSHSRCSIHIAVPSKMFAHATVSRMESCDNLSSFRSFSVVASFQYPLGSNALDSLDLSQKIPPPAFLSPTNHLYFYVPVPLCLLSIRFKASEVNIRNKLIISFTTPTTGYMMTPGYDGVRSPPRYLSVTEHLHIPSDHRVLVSFQRFDISAKRPCGETRVEFYVLTSRYYHVWEKCNENHIPADEYTAHAVKVHVSSGPKPLTGFKMLFSFHPIEEASAKLESGFFNCSVAHYSSFQRHLHCNLEPECWEGQDETEHCPFSNSVCRGKVASSNKCFHYVTNDALGPTTSCLDFPTRAQRYCKSLGGNLATVRSPTELQDFLKLFHYGKQRSNSILTGMIYNSLAVPNMYRKMVRGDDSSIVYSTNHLLYVSVEFQGQELFHQFNVHAAFDKFDFLPSQKFDPDNDVICETVIPSISAHADGVHKAPLLPTLKPPSAPLDHANITLTNCPAGHLTHTFLICDPLSHCVQDDYAYFCASYVDSSDGPPMKELGGRKRHSRSLPKFECDNHDTISFTLVCDFHKDCKDQSDEKFCMHRPCEGRFVCENRQCVTYEKRCDMFSDCLDSSDERHCAGYKRQSITLRSTMDPPAVIDLDGNGYFTQRKIDNNESCPDTHYQCRDERGYCLPVYTRCNGYYDCLDREDEDSCGNITCPGFYRCQASTVCVHTDHLCDGWPQCPRHDDEWLCDMICPVGCFCQGLAFRCYQSFSVSLFPELRYLDASGSGIQPHHFTDNTYLVLVRLLGCSVADVVEMNLPNLQVMDLSHNNMTVVNVTVFLKLQNLKYLSLSHNPLSLLYEEQSMLTSDQEVLEHIDLSHTNLQVFHSQLLRHFCELQRLNLSNTNIHTVSDSGFVAIKHLKELDLSSSPVVTFPDDLFKGLKTLYRIKSGNYKLCCKDLLPESFDQSGCSAPHNELSSCEDLLRSQTYRGFLWLITLLSVIGNLCCFIIRSRLLKTVAKSSYNVFVTSLCFADLLMGFYTMIIGVADELFRGQYVHLENKWTNSTVCKMAGFLSLLSNELSALNIWLITLDRFIVLRLPFSRVRFQTRSAFVACLTAWLICCIVAAVPLLPTTSHWEFYSQTGICIPLPVTRTDFRGRGYSFGVMIVFNFFLFLLIAAGQGFIYWSVQKNTMTTDTTKKSRDTTVARRLITVAVTDFLCWFPIGLCGLMASFGTPISGEISVAFAIFVLPLNSAFNPFLYTFNMVIERRRKVQEKRLIAVLQETLQSQKN